MFQTKNLMTNHVHLVATPIREDSLAKAVDRTHLAYAQYVNRLHGRSGHLWQNRFYSCILDEDHYWAARSTLARGPTARLAQGQGRKSGRTLLDSMGKGSAMV
jgi:hypothetical protein